MNNNRSFSNKSNITRLEMMQIWLIDITFVL